MKQLVAVAAVLSLATAVTVGARSTDAPPAVVHTHVATVSDPDPADCLLCAGDPAVHVRAIWAVQKKVAYAYRMRLL